MNRLPTLALLALLVGATATPATAANVTEAKTIGVNWKCSRTVLGRKVNSEDMQEALIVIRNKKL